MNTRSNFDLALPGRALEHQEQLAVSAPDSLSMLNEIYTNSLNQRLLEDQYKNCQENLPDVSLKQYYLQEISDLRPVSRGGTKQLNNDGSKKWKKAAWPPSAKSHKVEVPEFQAYLKAVGTGESQITVHVLGADRLLGMVETPAENKSVLEVLVAIRVAKLQAKIVELEVMHPGYAWVKDMIEAVQAYCNFHLKGLNDMSSKTPTRSSRSTPMRSKICVMSLEKAPMSGHSGGRNKVSVRGRKRTSM